MKLFLSWSGEVSKETASFLSEWIPNVLQEVEPFFSHDIEKGTRWGQELASELENCDFGICIVTPNNHESPWILFEAGAISKSVSRSKFAPILIGLDKTDLNSPLGDFQLTAADKEDIFSLVNTINTALERSLPIDRLKEVFEKWWPDLESHITEAQQKLQSSNHSNEPHRPDREILEEILERVRALERTPPPQPSVYSSKFPMGLQDLGRLAELAKAYESNTGVDKIMDVFKDSPGGLLSEVYQNNKRPEND